MILIDGVDFELPQIGKEPTMGYVDDYIEKKMISGKIRRIYKGRRFTANFSYAFLTEEQIAMLNEILYSQVTQGYVAVEINTPFGSFAGEATIELKNEQTRFKYNRETDSYVWTNWQIVLKAVNYD